jgi:hypothetical protein
MDVTMVVFCPVCSISCVVCWRKPVFCHRKHALTFGFLVIFYPGSGLGIRYLCRRWVQKWFYFCCFNACSHWLLCLIVGRVFTVFLSCCILFLGSAIGWWLFAATVYWMFGQVAWLFVGWWPSGWMWVMRWLLVGFFFFLGHRPCHVHDLALVSLWGC